MHSINLKAVPEDYAYCPQEIVDGINVLPPGIVGIATAFLGRYREFDVCLDDAWFPPESEMLWCMGIDPCHHFNQMVEKMYSDNKFQWVWILGDDHTFPADLWWNLYQRNVDIVVPLCLKKDRPPRPLLEHGDYNLSYWDWIKGRSGLMPWDGTVGNAGMLIRRSVFDEMEAPWFRAGVHDPGHSSSDLNFCRCIQRLGFIVNVDLDNPIGHLQHYAVWPKRDEDGVWKTIWV